MSRSNDEKISRPVVKGRRRLATNGVFDIFLDHLVEAPDREIADFLVVQPKHRSSGGISGISVLPVVGDKFALLDCYRHPIEQMSLEAPKGFIEPGEAPAHAALRELAEETGLSCSPTNLIGLGIVSPDPGVISGRLALFAALDCIGTIRVGANEFGIDSVRLLSLPEFEAAAAAEQVQDAVTLALLYRYRAWRGTRGA